MSSPEANAAEVTRLAEQARRQADQVKQAQDAFNKTASHVQQLAQMFKDAAGNQ